MQFAFEAMTEDGRNVADRIDAASRNDAVNALRGRGMMVVKLDAVTEAAEAGRSWWPTGRRMSSRDLMVFTRQMTMLLDAGAALVPALEAIERQTRRPAARAIVRELREHVESGGPLSEACAERPQAFSAVFRSMVAAGEATATLGQTFSRLAEMADRQRKAIKTVVGALTYPAILLLMCTSVVGVLIGFVVPRFRDLFLNLKAPLPLSTEIMFKMSEFMTTSWPIVLGVLVASVGGLIFALRQPGVLRWLDEAILHVPVIGEVRRRLLTAGVLRVWAAMLRSHVPLLDTIRQSQTAVASPTFARMVQSIEDSVASGGRVGRVLASSGLVEPVIASAVATGEENGRLAEAVEFVSRWIDEDNTQLVAATTRIVEPLLLAVMGAIVGGVAMSLFLPLFDLATAAH
jgi:type IV pilus assembly protein PilC